MKVNKKFMCLICLLFKKSVSSDDILKASTMILKKNLKNLKED